MWKSAYLILLAMILAIIGLSIDLLMWESNVGDYSAYVSIEVNWGYQNAQLQIEFYDKHDQSYSRNIYYDDYYTNYCSNPYEVQPSYCNDLNSIQNAGTTYMTCGCFGTVLLGIAFLLCLLLLSTKKCCRCKCRLRWVIAILVGIAGICYGVAFGTFESSFSPDVNNLLDKIVDDKYPNLSKIDWMDFQLAGSIILMIIAMTICFIALIVIMCIDRQYDQLDGPNAPIVGNKTLYYYQQPSQPSQIQPQPNNLVVNVDGNFNSNPNVYGEPDTIYAPMLQPNTAGNYRPQQ